MKTFKKAISLVLVFAMLASFAGMTGYKYSPMSIEAEAKHFKTAGGVEITMWSTIYKINHDYTMTYPDKDDSSVSRTSEVGDYAIPHFDNENNLSYTLVFPEGTTQFNAGCSIDGVYWTSYGTLTSTANPSYWSSGKAVMDRTGNEAMYWDYGALYRDNLLGKGVEGFRDIGKIKWRVVYTCNGKEYTEYWTVDVLDWDRQSAGNSQAWNGAATSSKPTDSHAGKNALTNIHVPATLYLSGTSVVQSLNSRRGDPRRFDTFAMFTVPSGAYDVTIYQVDIDDNPIKNQLTFSKPDGTGAAATGTASNAGVSGNTYKWNLAGTASAGEVYYRIEYKMDVTDINGNPDTITYIQYAASYAKTMPNYNAVWAIVNINEGDGRAEAKTKFSFVHEMGFLQAFMVSGVNVNVTASGLSANYNGSWNWYDHASGTNALGFQQVPSQSKEGDIRWTGGATGTTSTSNSMGADIYYDAQAKTANASNYDLINTTASSIGMDMFLMHYKDGNDSGQKNYKWCRTDSYGEKWSAYAAGWSYTASSTTYGDDNPKNKLTNVYSGTTYTEYSKGIDPDDGLGSGTQDPTQTSYYNYTLSNLGSIPSLRCAVHTSGESRNSYFGTYYYHYVAYGWHVNMHSVDRTEPHTLMEAARKSNYVKQEMDATWWNAYRKAVFAAYVNCGNLQTGEQTSYVYDNVTIDVNISKPVYKFADYSALNTQILTAASWDRGGKAKVNSDGKFIDEYGNEVKTNEDKWYEKLQAEDNYIPWGASYGKWNSKTYATDYGKVTDEDNVFLAAYDLVFTEDTEAETMEFKVSNTPRTGAYYYTTATWNAYTAARDHAVGVYNYPNSTVATFDYDTAYPAKAATEGGNQANVGLACYHQAEIDAAVSNLQTKRAALVKYDVNNNNYDIDQYYRKLLSQLGSIAYDNSAKALFDFNTKHGFEGITSEIYDEATIVFRASAPEDVFDYIWTAAESSDPDYLGDGHVKVDEDGNPLYKKEDGTIVLASEAGDVGILEFPRADGTLLPVGRGNTFSQLYFDNSAKSQYAVTSARAALRNRLRWRMGGGGAAGYEYLGMVEGVYNQEGLTEDKLNNNPTQYFWSGKEHQDDILREVYALYRVKTTLRLAANYREVVEALNNENNYIPSYDIGGTAYKANNLQNVTMFKTYTPASAWDTVSITANGATYHTSGKTWYTEDSWAGFIADRNKLAAMIYNGSTRTSTNSPYGDASEIGQEYVYDSGVANKYYTYDVELSSGLPITNTYYTNGFYGAGGRLAAEYQDDINQAVKDYKAWFDGKKVEDDPDTEDIDETNPELELKVLDEYIWTPSGEAAETIDPTKDVESIESKLDQLYAVIDVKQDISVFTGSVNGETVTADLNTEQHYSYSEADRTRLHAAIDALKAEYAGADFLGEKAEAFNDELAELNNDYNAVIKKGTIVDKSYWNAIVAHIAKLAGVAQITSENIQTAFLNKFTIPADVMIEVVGTEAEPELGAFYRAGVATTQEQVNAAVEQLYNALNKEFPSGEVATAANAVKAYTTAAENQFKVYNYDFKGEAQHKLSPIFSSDSITALNTAAEAAIAKKYNVIKTAKATVNADITAVNNLKNLKTDSPAGVLEHATVDMTYLNKAIAYAEGILYTTDDQGNKVLAFETVTNFDGKTAKVNTYSDASVSELLTVLGEAAELDENMSYTNQLEVDKLTFAIYEETTDATEYFITSDNQPVYRIWPSGEMNWGTARWEQNLYGIRDQRGYMGAPDYGLKPGPAYYGFLEAEIKGNTIIRTVINEETGEVISTTVIDEYIGTVWNADGSLILNDNGEPAGKRIFENWSSYMDAYTAAVTLFDAQDKTVDQQTAVDDAAKLLYDKRNALKELSLYFPNNTQDFETAKGWYNELSAYVQKTDVTRYGYEWVDILDPEDETKVIGQELVKSENPLSSVTQSVYIYNGVTPEIEAEIESFRAKYASDNSTEDYNSLGAAQTLYNNIKTTLTDPSTGVLYTVKKTNDESLIAGMLDLTGRIDPETQELVGGYIAGTWTVTFDEETGASTGVYATDLLNSTQAGLLQTYLTNAQNKINSKEDATAGFGGALGALTTIVFDETKKPATDLQFADAMKQQMVEFFGMTFIANVPDYYKVPASFLNDDGKLELYVFDQTNANKLLTENVNPFYNNEENWPCIYEINNLQVTQDTSKKTSPTYGVYSVTVWPSGTTDSEGNPVSSGTGADKKIDTIMKEIGANSKYYADVIAQTNSYHTDALAWIVENAIVDGVTTTDGEVASVILADLNNSVDGDNGSKTTVKDSVLTDINNAGKPIEQWADVEAEIDYDLRTESNGWYTEGYGCYTDEDGRVYYLYKGNKEIQGSNFGSWFNDTTGTLGNPNANRNEGIDVLQSILDKDYEGNSTYREGKNYYGSTLSERFTHTDYSQIANIAKNERPSGTGTEDYAASIASAEVGWSQYYAEKLQTSIQTDQDAIDKSAALIYEKIQGLTLLPATEAYRDVYNTYLSIFGQHIDDGNWNGNSYSSATTISNVDFKFYNINDTQLSRIQAEFTLNEEAVPPYGLVLRSRYSNFDAEYIKSDGYTNNETDNPWYNLVYISDTTNKYYNPNSFMNKFVNTDAEDLITIDQAEKVKTYDKTDNITSIMETLVDDYLSKLEFKDRDFSYLDAVVKAFLGDNLSDGLAAVKSTLQGMGFTVGYNYDGEFYPLSYYTDDSLLQVAGILRYMNVLADGKIIEKIINTDKYQWIGDTFPLPIVFNSDYKGSFYTSTTDQNKIDSSKEGDNSVLLAFLTALNTQLVLKGVDTEKLVEQITLGDAIVPQKYDTTQPAWEEYENALANAKDYRDRAGEYDIRYQVSVIDAATSRLAAAIEALKEIVIADNYAPSMTLKTSVAAVDEFYSKEAYEVDLREADSASFTATGEGDNVTYTANPAAGTFFVPNSSGYSLIVYTNELDPRIVINLEDLEQKLADGTNGSADVMQDAAKKEYISINAVKTSGVTANVIAGTIVPAHNNIAEKLTVEKALAATANQAVEVTNSSEVKGSSAFAILAPRFVEGTATQAAVYTIQARDGSERNVDGGTVYGNPVNQLDFGDSQDPVDIKVLDSDNKIAIYIYYYSLKAADGTDEGINADGTALAAPAISGTHVPSALLSGEPGFKGTDWRNGVLLQRSFSSSHRVWEYVSEVKKSENSPYNNVNGTLGVPVYNDPTFGQLNTGSFYYVLDDEEDADIIAKYNTAKSISTTAGCMDYAAATVAKTAMINAIKAMSAAELSEMKASGRFYNYGDYETDEFGNVLYNGDEPKWINWAQAIGGKVENGDLVFVHVVDRWGNVVNRIIEITNLDENAPEVSSDEAGAVTIDETGGSGLADIQVHNGDFSLGEFKYEVSQSQNVIKLEGAITNKAEVNCASNVLTIVNLVPGKTYLIGAEDKAGNRSTTAVKADAEGHIVLTIDNKIVQTGEDMGLEGNSSAFTLNDTDTIILNSGEESSVINAKLEGNVFANRTIRHYITTKDNVEALKTVYQDGTVEEFTAENATVKDNGDGTLVWTIKRKLAEGEHKYDVYAKVNGKYETYYAVAVINATTRTVKIECTNVGQGATELKFSGSLSFDIANYISKEVPYGAQVTITAKAYTTYEGCEFYYWINNTTDRIINTADVYEFKAVANADYIAQFTNNSTCIDGKKFVVYVNNAKNVIDRFELAEGDDYAVPSGPVLPDYTFKGWSMTKAEVLASDKATVIVEPIYVLNASYTVSIAQGNYTATGAGTYTAEANQRAVVTISTSAKDGEGKDFLYWIDADTDEIVSYDRTYSFFCVKDTELAPVYGDASTVKAEPIVRITEVKFNAFSGKASFFAERSVPEEYTILQTGIVVTKTESIGTNEEVFVVGGASTAAGTSTSTANNGYYSASTSVATGQTVWARAYVIYETADGEILEVYGPVVSYTVD